VPSTHIENDRIPLLLIHGAWLSARSWENYSDYFARHAYDVSAPEWPRKQGDVEEMRETAEESAGLGVNEIVDHYEGLIGRFERPPVLIGHSYGGLFVELLLDRGLGRAGVAMSPAPPKGILKLPFSTLKAASPALAHPSKRHGIVTLTLDEFTYGFVNTFSPEKAAEAYERYAVPETGQIFYEAGFANFHLHPPTEVHFKNEERAPLLIVGADEDHTVPPRCRRRSTRSTSARPRTPTTSGSRAGRTCTWSPRTGRRWRRQSTAGSRAFSRPPGPPCSTHGRRPSAALPGLVPWLPSRRP
jgi:pimeloyl-ACP methyl ester carboxylesterase